MTDKISFEDIRNAAEKIRPYAHRTPVMTSQTLDRMAGCRIFFKCENFQKAGAFKFRGASNAVFSLPHERIRQGVATHSSGNHAAALALAAKLRGVPAYVVMPENSPPVKKAAVAGYGAKVVTCEPTLRAREQGLSELVYDTGAAVVHPYNQIEVIAGQGTAALELVEEIRDLDVVMAPVGGGGLMSGTSLAVHALLPGARLFGVEPEGADDACRSLQSGRLIPSVNPDTIADGLRTSLGELTFAILRKHLETIITVSDEEIIEAMRHVWERMKIVIEPSAAVAVAGALKEACRSEGKRVGIILSGGNLQLDRLPF